MPIVATAINELLLQSPEGPIRVCPATPEDWQVRFTLLAQGGMLVSSEKTGAFPDWVFFRSLRGGECRLANPWPGQARPYLQAIKPRERRTQAIDFDIHAEGANATFSWQTIAGYGYLLSPTPIGMNEWHVVPLAPQTNREPRTLGDATLGLPRMY